MSGKSSFPNDMPSREAPLNKEDPSLHLVIQPFRAHTLQYDETQPIPSSLFSNGRYSFVSVTSSAGEVTVVLGLPTPEDALSESDLSELGRPREKAGPWTVFRLKGPLDLSTPSRSAARLIC